VEWRSSRGLPLASAEWQEVHHRAKLPERRAFAEMLAERRPRRVTDLGCGAGLWLGLLDEILPAGCELVGLDSDRDLLEVASSREWSRPMRFEQLDLEAEPEAIPESDMALAFNVFQYLKDPAGLLSSVASNVDTLVVRQYDGGALRFGPMENRLRSVIEASLRASVASSDQFRHYDMDHVFALVANSPFSRREVGFELFARASPFAEDFRPYYEAMLGWTLSLLSDPAAEALGPWLADRDGENPERYFFEVDLTAVLS
jgi:trans-aconitate methyltransferase